MTLAAIEGLLRDDRFSGSGYSWNIDPGRPEGVMRATPSTRCMPRHVP
jgi:hypothetical protein